MAAITAFQDRKIGDSFKIHVWGDRYVAGIKSGEAEFTKDDGVKVWISPYTRTQNIQARA